MTGSPRDFPARSGCRPNRPAPAAIGGRAGRAENCSRRGENLVQSTVSTSQPGADDLAYRVSRMVGPRGGEGAMGHSAKALSQQNRYSHCRSLRKSDWGLLADGRAVSGPAGNVHLRPRRRGSCGDRYNTPETNRVSTTRSAFLFTGAGYVGASLTFPVALPGCAEARRHDARFLAAFGIGDPGAPRRILRSAGPRGGHPDGPVAAHANSKLGRRLAAEALSSLGSIPHGVRDLAVKLEPQALRLGSAEVIAIAGVDRVRTGDLPTSS